jgi:UDP-N-acetyl-D-glucosamine/UDP-N-acetyl-D-galactosamine dehydrogenase
MRLDGTADSGRAPVLEGDIDNNVVVIGLGYVGLPLAVALAEHFVVSGLDIDEGRVAELRRGHDRTNEVDGSVLARSTLKLTSTPDDCRGADMYIVTVPTPVNEQKQPDLRPLIAASKSVGRMIGGRRKPVVVFESTVYPGVTEDVCGPLIEEESGLVRGRDFFLGYSPERINPGDREHTVERIVKVIAGETDEVTERLAQVYGKVTSAGVFRAASIKAAEAAKVIENAQRDINIAFMNEITQIFAKLGLSIWDVLDAAGTKWNFLRFQPGLVGGHCIGVDPYYLSHCAKQLNHEPEVILSGRSINDGMGTWLADSLHDRLGCKAGSVLVMGLTFKEDVTAASPTSSGA